jgi:hypothetical protein
MYLTPDLEFFLNTLDCIFQNYTHHLLLNKKRDTFLRCPFGRQPVGINQTLILSIQFFVRMGIFNQ